MIRALGWCALAIGAGAAPVGAIAATESSPEILRGFFITAALSLFLGGLLLAGTARLSRPAGPGAALRLAFYGWVLIPPLAAPPLIASTGSLAGGVFEAYSALTTTGAILGDTDSAPRSILLWRAWLGWMGGLASLVLAVTVFAALDRRGASLRRTSLLTVERSDLFTNFGRAVRRLGLVYLLLTSAGFIALAVAGTPAFDALVLALSGISTSGYTARDGALLEYLPPPALIILAALCLAGAWNLAVQYELLSRFRTQAGARELPSMIGIGLACGAVALVFAGPDAAFAGALDGIFAITTAGFDAGVEFSAPAVGLLTLALIGGSPVSTSGGIKMPRILLLLRRAAGELLRVSHPSAAIRTRFAGRTVDADALAGVWAYAIAFPVALGLGAILVALGGADFDPAWRAAAACLANAGPLADVDFSSFSAASLAACASIMVLGRLEVLAAAAALYVIVSRD